MIVPTMSTTQIYTQIMEDYASLERKGNAQGAIFKSELKRSKLAGQTRCIDYTTAHCNKWNIVFKVLPNYFHSAYYLRCWEERGMTLYYVICLENGNCVVKLCTHFLQRYHQRLGLHFTSNSQMLRYFFQHNLYFQATESQIFDNGKCFVQLLFDNGIAVGWKQQGFIHLNTFLSCNSFNSRQRRWTKLIRQSEGGAETISPMTRSQIKIYQSWGLHQESRGM